MKRLNVVVGWLKKNFWEKVFVPALIPDKLMFTVEFKELLGLYDARIVASRLRLFKSGEDPNTAGDPRVAREAGKYNVVRIPDPLLCDGGEWIVLQNGGSRVGAARSWWEAQIRTGRVVVLKD